MPATGSDAKRGKMDNKEHAIGQIVANLGYPQSETLSSIWEVMVTEQEAIWIASLPATPAQVAASTGQCVDAVSRGLRDLYNRGLVLAEPQGAEVCYTGITNAGVLMDLVLFDRRYLRYGPEFLDAWRAFYNRELVHEHDYPEPASRPFRVVPVLEEVQDGRTALPHDEIVAAIQSARRISVEHCPCRTRERLCDNPTETCLGLDEVADYIIARGIGREISAAQALDILRECEELGLMHLTENSEHPRVICNCCSCCCVFLRAMSAHGKEHVVASSRYVAIVDPGLCEGCGTCEGRCHVAAITLSEGRAHVLEAQCLGCGLCVSTCPAGAVTLQLRLLPTAVPDVPSGFGLLLRTLPAR